MKLKLELVDKRKLEYVSEYKYLGSNNFTSKHTSKSNRKKRIFKNKDIDDIRL